MKHLLLAGLFPLVLLTGCNGTLTSVLPVINDPNIAVCASALIQTGITDPAALAFTAATSPACEELAANVIQTIIDDVVKQNVHSQHMRMMQQQH